MTPANISRTEAANAFWDVLVIGGGPAGAVAARQSAIAGYRTLLVDKQPFPRAKVCGSCVNARALRVLSLLGMEACLAELPAAPFDSFELTCGKRQAKITLPPGKAITRREFDDVLVRAAIRAGVRWLPETAATVADVSDAGSSRMVALTDVVNRQCQSAKARIVFVADGLGSPSLYRRKVEFSSRINRASRIGLGGTVKGHDGRFSDNTIHMSVFAQGYVGFVALPDGSLNVAAALDVDFLKSRGDVASGMSEVLANSQIGSLDLRGVAWRGTPRLTRRLIRPVSTRVLVLGDAAGYVEPFTGEGIAWAITSGALAASLIPWGVVDWTRQLEVHWLRLSRNLIQQRQFLCRVLAKTLRSYRMATAATRLLSTFPALATPIAIRFSALPKCAERYLQTTARKASYSRPSPKRRVPVRKSIGEYSR